MLNAPQPACLVIADISGYTSYLAGTELDHAQDILADLMATTVGALRPTFRLAKLEGDAAFMYAMTGSVDGSALQDLIEGCYFAFQRRLRDIRQASTCECNACILIPSLDLKFVAHYGEIVRQRIAGHEELAGREVIVVHRLLKNDVSERTGFDAYALYTDACVGAMGIADPAAGGLREHRETYDVIGDIVGWVRDLTTAWTAEQQRARIVIEPDAAMWSLETNLPAPPSLVWDYITSPIRRPQWQAAVTEIEETTTAGRRGPGTVNHCIHGKDAIVEEILDWQPPLYQTIRFQVPQRGVPRFTMMDLLEPDGAGGTRMTMRLQRPRSTKDRLIATAMRPMLEKSVRDGLTAIEPLLRDEVARLTADTAVMVEPPMAVSATRYLQVAVGAGVVDSA